MKATRFALLLAAPLLAAGCKKDGGPFLMPNQPLAFVRYVNAVPDTFSTDWRPIDAIENSPPAIQMAFRGFTPYQAMAPGARHLRIFPNPGGNAPPPEVVSQILIDETVNFEANKFYTVIHFGFTRADLSPADRLVVIEDLIPESIGTQIAVRVINVGGAGNNPLDAYVTATSSAGISGSPAFPSIADGAASGYVMMAPGEFWLRVTQSGNTSELVSGNQRRPPAGAAGSPEDLLTPIGGYSMAGSAMTAFVFPRSVAQSNAPQSSAFTAPAIVYLIDKHPPQQ